MSMEFEIVPTDTTDESAVLGTIGEVRRRLLASLPDLQMMGTDLAILPRDNYTAEFFLGLSSESDDEPLPSVSVVVRGYDETVIETLCQVAHENGWTLIDGDMGLPMCEEGT